MSSRSLEVVREYEGVSPDCPALRKRVFESLVHGGKQFCAFSCLPVSDRSVVPTRWADEYAYALVRRGVIIRQCFDEAGRATAVDAAGSGCLFRFEPVQNGRTAMTAYATSDALVCLIPRSVVDHLLDTGGPLARELFELQTQALRRVECIAHARARTEAVAAVAALVLVLTETLTGSERKDRVPYGLQQRDLAALLGLRHETVCRALRELESMGHVAREPSGIAVLDRAGLEAL